MHAKWDNIQTEPSALRKHSFILKKSILINPEPQIGYILFDIQSQNTFCKMFFFISKQL